MDYDTAGRSLQRVLAAAGLIIVITILTAVVLLLSGRGPARAETVDWAASGLSSSGPHPVPALNPPIQTRQASEGASISAGAPESAQLQVVQFRPSERLQRGQTVSAPTTADKPLAQSDAATGPSLEEKRTFLQEAYVAPDLDALLAPSGWTQELYEGFDGAFPGNWILEDFGNDGAERFWGPTGYAYYSAPMSAWPAAFGADALDPSVTQWYTDNLNSWIEYGPFDFENAADILVNFALYYDTEPEFDRIRFCVSVDFTNYNCSSWSGFSDGWTDQAFSLTSYAGYSQVWLAWVFTSDGSVSEGYYGPYIDEIHVWSEDVGAPPPPTPTPDPGGELIQNGSFETGDLTGWQTGFVSSPIKNGGFERGPDGSWTEYSTHGWPLIVDSFAGSVTPHRGSWAAWLGGEHDEISFVSQDVALPSGSPTLSYWHWIASEDLCNYDFGGIVVIDATGPNVVDVFTLCSNNNTGGWVQRTVDLSDYAGQTVELQIRAETDDSLNSNLFVDDARLESALLASARPQNEVASPALTSETASTGISSPAERKRAGGLAQGTPDQDFDNTKLFQPDRSGKDTGQSAPQPLEDPTQAPAAPATETPPSQIGAILQGMAGADETSAPLNVGVSDMTYVHGAYAAYLWRAHNLGMGVDSLHQTINVPASATDLAINLWYGVATEEAVAGNDWFCIYLAEPTDHTMILVDLGCVDATETTPHWQEFTYGLNSTEVASIAGQPVDLVFSLFSDIDLFGSGPGQGATTGWVDYVRAYATGGSTGEAIDPNEPNDDAASATAISCGETITTSVIGDALGGYDEDWFRLGSVPQGRIDIDIDADTQFPPSELDSVVRLWDSGTNWLATNDDDGTSFDSYLVYTSTVSNGTFYISVESYSGIGSPDSFYDLTVECAGSGSGPPPPSPEEPPTTDAWTVMLYLNAEDPGFEDILTGYRTAIEQFIGAKSSFLNVAILYDGPSGSSDSGTTRYLVQPNGNYTLGTNKWDMGERNMGDPATLSQFVTWAMDQFPAEHYYLAIDDHGDGVYGISWDPTSGSDQLTPPELYAALKNATRNGTRKIDIFDYEACLMGLAENAFDLKDWVDYVVFFQQISWGLNTYPEYFRDLAASDTPLQVGRRIIERYNDGALNANGGRGYPFTISLIETSKMAAVRAAVTSFGNAIKATDTRTQKDAINDARSVSQAFAADNDATDPRRADYIDLWDLADKGSNLAPGLATAVKSAVQAAVAHERHASGGVGGFIWDHSGVHGLSIYYPPSKSSGAFDGYGGLYQMSQQGGWDEFLEWAVPPGIGRGLGAFRTEIKLVGGDTFAYKYIYLPVVVR